MKKLTSKFPETDARSVNIDNSQAVGPIILGLIQEDQDDDEDVSEFVGLTDPNEVLEDLDPVFQSALRKR